MIDLLERLAAVLGDAYRIERELTPGGMSRLFLATEASLNRQVVIKLLPPELASEVSAARFRQEIELAAQLQHPHILPVLAAGARDDLLYYVMPYVAGESLRRRLQRDGRLPVDEAVRLLREIADGLAYAHAQGIVHRDLKPENVLLQQGHAVLTDFGVARALSAARAGGRLTATGIVVGTPGYMAPEQVAGDQVDARADLYALAVMGYELLAGAPPFAGPSAQAVFSAQFGDPPMPVATLREGVPAGVSAAIARALAKNPADRFGSAAELGAALAGGPATGRPDGRRLRRWAIPVSPLLLLALAATLWVARSRRVAPLVDASVVMVAPFRVSGADPSLAYLREGMLDLLATKLTGEGGVRAADPRTTMSAWRRSGGSEEASLSQEETLAVARAMGAGRVILGGVVGTPRRVVLNASLLRVADGSRAAEATVEGSPDSLPALIDHLAGELLARGAGEGVEGLASLTSTSLTALRAYLDGQAAYRRSDYGGAMAHFERALAADSTFALAALRLVSAAAWRGPVLTMQRAIDLAWRERARLSRRDQAILDTWRSPDYPEAISIQRQLEVYERALAVAPDVPDLWYFAGDMPYHRGSEIALAGAMALAGTRFRRALELDSNFALPVYHLVQLAFISGDTAGARKYERWYRTLTDGRGVRMLPTWWLASATGDSARLAEIRGRLAELADDGMEAFVGLAQVRGASLDDADSAAAIALRLASPGQARAYAGYYARLLALNRGRPRAARAMRPPPGEPWVCAECGALSVQEMPGVTPDDQRRWLDALDALFWDGDGAAGATAARAMRARLARNAGTTGALDTDRCILGLWHRVRGEPGRGEIPSAPGKAGSVDLRAALPFCVMLLEAMDAVAGKRSDAGAALARADSAWLHFPRVAFVRNANEGACELTAAGNMVLARLYETRGDLAGALARIRRRPLAYDAGVWYLSTGLREEGRLAALAGDRAEAVRAYRHYLALRSNPEPELQPGVERVRAELERLESVP